MGDCEEEGVIMGLERMYSVKCDYCGRRSKSYRWGGKLGEDQAFFCTIWEFTVLVHYLLEGVVRERHWNEGAIDGNAEECCEG